MVYLFIILILAFLYAFIHNRNVKHTYKSLDLNRHKLTKQDYLKSPQWQVKRKQTLSRDSYTCQQCNTSGIPLEVHHLQYTHFGDEPLSHLISLCRDCHQSIHNAYGYDYNHTFPLLTSTEG